jgi:hypothetical protein
VRRPTISLDATLLSSLLFYPFQNEFAALLPLSSPSALLSSKSLDEPTGRTA